MLNLILDLDGTIIDVSEKYFQTYKYLLLKADKKHLSKIEYWELKRTKVSELEILKKTDAESIWGNFSKDRREIIETEPFIKFDKLFTNIKSLLTVLNDKYNLILVTLRHDDLSLKKELKNLGIEKCFNKILSGANVEGGGHNVKFELVKKNNITDIVAVVGDMPTDIKLGKSLGVTSVAVKSGLCNELVLEKYSPDSIIEGLEGLEKILK